MPKISNDFYFSSFSHGMCVVLESSELLGSSIESFSICSISDIIGHMKALNNTAAEINHHLISQTSKAFITPIERPNIIYLGSQIYNLTRSISHILSLIYVSGVSLIKRDALDLSFSLSECCFATKTLIDEFQNYKRSKLFKDLTEDVDRAREKSYNIYIKSMYRLHHANINPIDIIIWREIYEGFNISCLLCENLSETVESIIIENT